MVRLRWEVNISDYAYQYSIRMYHQQVERQNAMLTKKDRMYLLGEADPSEYADYKAWSRQRRKQIRERVIESIIDFNLVATNLPGEDQRRILFDQEPEIRKSMSKRISDILIFISNMGPEYIKQPIEHGLKLGSQHHRLINHGEYVEYEVDLDISETRRTDISTLVKEHKQSGGLSEQQRASLLAAHVNFGNQFGTSIMWSNQKRSDTTLFRE